MRFRKPGSALCSCSHLPLSRCGKVPAQPVGLRRILEPGIAPVIQEQMVEDSPVVVVVAQPQRWGEQMVFQRGAEIIGFVITK